MKRVGPYEVHEQLGRGGMGAVFRAVDARDGREVALKLLTGFDERAGRRLVLEAKALSRVQHKNVVALLDAGEDEGRPWLALELMRGGSLQDRLDRSGPLPPEQAARLVLALAGGLAHSHHAGVLHRDLKPANVLLPDGGGEPKLTDFGLAGFTVDLSQSRLTKAGMLMGSPGYWAPEEAAGETSQIGPLADVYGLGAILYAALAGRPPISGESLTEVLVATASHSPEPTGKDAALDAIALRCLRKRPDERYPSIERLGADLERYLAVGAPPVADATKARSRSGRVIVAPRDRAPGGAVRQARRRGRSRSPRSSRSSRSAGSCAGAAAGAGPHRRRPRRARRPRRPGSSGRGRTSSKRASCSRAAAASSTLARRATRWRTWSARSSSTRPSRGRTRAAGRPGRSSATLGARSWITRAPSSSTPPTRSRASGTARPC